ncbi:glycosyltransferase family 4 protein [Patescibacteria group bacterium]|nr:glycosyltransferase family 4 protein [Patescibacteria group bacterium]
MKIKIYTMEYPPFKGGVGNYYAGLAKAMEPRLDIKVSRVANSSRWWQVLLLMLFNRSDYVWVGQILPIGTAAYICNRLFRKKYFVSLHGMDINLAQQNKPGITRKILKNAELITVNSEYTKKRIIGWEEMAGKIEVVYPCPNVEMTEVDDSLIEQIKSSYRLEGKQIMLSVNRLTERKGTQDVIHIMPELLEKFPDLIYVVIGSGDYLPELKRIVQVKNLEKNILILTGVGNNELSAFYSIANLFIMPTIDDGIDVEGFGIVYLEAGSFGVPVIATPVGGAREAVRDQVTGIYTSKTSMVKDISSLLSNRGLAMEMGKKAKNIIKREYTYTAQSKKILQRL